MADSTLRLNFQAMLIRVAEYLGVADYSGGAAAVPTDAHDLDLCKRLVNDGYARFISDNERGWNFLTVPLTLTFGTGLVAANPARYYLPDDFYGVLLTPFTGTNAIRVLPVAESAIREASAVSNASGRPTYVAVRAIATTETSTGQRWEAIFYPAPSGTEVVTAIYRRFPNKLVNNTDTALGGVAHDRTVLASALAAAELQRLDKQGEREVAYQQSLAKSLRIDMQASDQRKKDYGDRSEDDVVSRRPWLSRFVDATD